MNLNWEPLSSGEPIPGDPIGIQQLSSYLNNYAAECSSAITKLTSIYNIDWESDAAITFRSREEVFESKLKLVSQRLSDASLILGPYATQVESFQSSGQAMVSQAKQLVEEIQSLSVGAQQQHTALATPPHTWTGPDYSSELSSKESELQQLRNSFNELVMEFKEISQQCASHLQNVSHDALSNNLFKFVKDLYHDIGDGLDGGLKYLDANLPDASRVLHDVSNIAGLMALVMLPFPPAAAVLELTSVLSSGLALESDEVLYSQGKDGVTTETLGSDEIDFLETLVPGDAGVAVGVSSEALTVAEYVKANESQIKSALVKASGTDIFSNREDGLPFGSTGLVAMPKGLQSSSITQNILGRNADGDLSASDQTQSLFEAWTKTSTSLTFSPPVTATVG